MTTTLKKSEFESQRAAIVTSIDAIFSTADSQKRPLNADELQRVAALEAAIESLGSRPAPRKTSHDAIGGYNSDGTPKFPQEQVTHRTGGKRAAELFRDHAPDNGGFQSLSDLAGAIMFNDGSRLASVAGNSKGTPSDGGFSVPSSLAYALLDGALESEVVRPRANVIGMTSETQVYWDFDNSDHTDGELFGALKGAWQSEGDESTVKVAKLRQVRMTAKKLAFLTAASNEMLSDSPEFEQRLSERMQSTISFNFDSAFLTTGTGAGQPRSILNDPALITVAKEGGQTAATLVYENLVKMFARMHPASLGNSVWVFNSNCIPQLLQMSISVGTGGSHIPVMTETAGQFRILTRPVVFTEKANTLGTLGDAFLCDFSQYLVGIMRDGIRLSRSEHVYFTSDQVAWRIVARVEGMGTWKSALTPLSGSSLSPFVTLAARA